ncbi:hypothetical protein J3R30DRAFT_1119939 [Lentinula aciculospora]|uniref:Galactose-binding like protein n=1 Tax=Lentinula aciculospora TaxID=153920 RepID=A0A9W8ZZ98_9AGAR|nr:hypothetical protein J3R30DRAFT_1119939 [Lentinula aciculospora]
MIHSPEIAMKMVSLITPETTIKVSSTLDKSAGRKNLVDGSPETCWTSQQGLPQTITLIFPSSSSALGVIPKTLSITFQGGFVGRTCAVHLRPVRPDDSPGNADWRLLTYVYPEDVNRRQTFTLPSLSHTPTTTSTIIPSASLSSLTPSTPSAPSMPIDAELEDENSHTNKNDSENRSEDQDTRFKQGFSALRLTFESSSDFFGRVTVYDLDLKGYQLGLAED